MFNVRITGLDKLRCELEDAQRAVRSLDGTIATLKFNPGDTKSVAEAIRQMEAAVDSRTAPYHDNDLVARLAQELKDTYRQELLKAQLKD